MRIVVFMVATRHRRGSLTLPRSPCAHAAPTAPAGDGGFGGRLLPHHPAAFPFWQEGRLQRDTFEAFSGFTRVAACALASPALPDISGGFSRAVARFDCSVGYRGVSTIPRAGLSPAGDRDPGGLWSGCFQAILTSFRDALPGTANLLQNNDLRRSAGLRHAIASLLERQKSVRSSWNWTRQAVLRLDWLPGLGADAPLPRPAGSA